MSLCNYFYHLLIVTIHIAHPHISYAQFPLFTQATRQSFIYRQSRILIHTNSSALSINHPTNGQVKTSKMKPIITILVTTCVCLVAIVNSASAALPITTLDNWSGIDWDAL
jgi:hypothetical protein